MITYITISNKIRNYHGYLFGVNYNYYTNVRIKASKRAIIIIITGMNMSFSLGDQWSQLETHSSERYTCTQLVCKI